MKNATTAALLLCFVSGCGGGETPPTTPSVDSPASSASSASAATSPSAVPSDTPTPPSSDSAKPADGPSPPTDKRLEDAKMTKTTSSGGTYAVNVVAAAGISADDVVRAIGKVRDQNDDCYKKLFKAQLTAHGKTTYEITIDAKGKTKSAKLKGDDVKSADVTKCLEKLIKGITWDGVTDKAGGKTTVDWAVAGN